MYEIISKKGDKVAFRDDEIKAVLVAKDGLFSSRMVIHTGDSTITIKNLDRKRAMLHYNILNSMIIDQEEET